MNHLVTVKVAQETLRKVAQVIHRGEELGDKDILYSLIAMFPDGYSAEINVSNGNPPHIDPILLDPQGNRAALLEPVDDRLEGTYTWHLGENSYTVVLD